MNTAHLDAPLFVSHGSGAGSFNRDHRDSSCARSQTPVDTIGTITIHIPTADQIG